MILIKVVILFVILICISSYANKLESNSKLIECDKFAPHGQQTTAILFGGGGLMLFGFAIAAFTYDSESSYNDLVGIPCSIMGTIFTGLSIGFQITSIKNWNDYKNCMISTDISKEVILKMVTTIPIQIPKRNK
jgi:hypothetical protein